MPKISQSQELLYLRFLNLVQMLGMTFCIVGKRLILLLLIIQLYLSVFLSLQSNFSAPMTDSSFKFCWILRVAKYTVGKKTKVMLFIFALFFHFSISHSNVIHKEICVNDFSGSVAHRILKFDTNVEYDFLYCGKKNQSPPPPILLLFVHYLLLSN